MQQEIISQGRIEVIFQSQGCPCINITFPNLNIHLEPPSFYSFVSLVDHITKDNFSNSNADQMILVGTPYEGIDLHFRLRELKELKRILRKAVFKLETRKLYLASSFSEN